MRARMDIEMAEQILGCYDCYDYGVTTAISHREQCVRWTGNPIWKCAPDPASRCYYSIESVRSNVLHAIGATNV